MENKASKDVENDRFQQRLLLATALVAAGGEAPRLVDRQAAGRAGCSTSGLADEMHVVGGVGLKRSLAHDECHVSAQIGRVLGAGGAGDQARVQWGRLTCFGDGEAGHAQGGRSFRGQADRRTGFSAHVGLGHLHLLIERVWSLDAVGQPHAGLAVGRVHADIITCVQLGLGCAKVHVQRVGRIFTCHADSGEALIHHGGAVVDRVDQVIDRRGIRVRELQAERDHFTGDFCRVASGDQAILDADAGKARHTGDFNVAVGTAVVGGHVRLVVLGGDVGVRILIQRTQALSGAEGVDLGKRHCIGRTSGVGRGHSGLQAGGLDSRNRRGRGGWNSRSGRIGGDRSRRAAATAATSKGECDSKAGG